jgi:uncharacterized protein (DUF1697 family)
MNTFVSLFRGINVGGHRQIKMDQLKDLHASLGLRDVFSYIQSGNVIFQSDDTDETRIQKQLEDSVEQKFGFHVEVIVRSATELQDIIAKNPFQSQQDKESKRITVMFLAMEPDHVAQEDLLKTYVGVEELFIMGKELYIYYTQGIGRSKLSHAFIEKKLKTVGTARNWNTILQLQKLVEQSS